MNPSCLFGVKASDVASVPFKTKIPLAVPPFPNAQLFPVNVTDMSYTFFPLARGLTVPAALHPTPGTLSAPVLEIVIVTLSALPFAEIPLTVYVPVIAADVAGVS